MNPYEDANEGGEPEDGVDCVDCSVSVGIGEALGSLEDGEGSLVDEGGYAEPALCTTR